MSEQVHVDVVNNRLKEIVDIAGHLLERSKNPETDGKGKKGEDKYIGDSLNGGSGSEESIKMIITKAHEARKAMGDVEKLLLKGKESNGSESKRWSPSIPAFIKDRFSQDKKLQVYVAEVTKSTQSFLDEFTKRMKKENVILNINCDVSRIQTGALLVVCPNLSRLQPDIDSCLKGIQSREQMVVLVLHFKRESSLPKLPSATQLVTDAKYNNIQFIDMAFDDKIYDCEMNTMARDQLTDFIGKL